MRQSRFVFRARRSVDQNLLLRAVKKHAKEQWMVLYIERWLKAPVQEEDGRLGQAEIQEAASPSATSDTLDRTHLAARSEVVRPLADGSAAGSMMGAV
jgi:hypothetical protein